MSAAQGRVLVSGAVRRKWPGMPSYNKPFAGVVVSTKTGQKSIMVQVTRLQPHPKYPKILKHRKKYMCHDEHEECVVGDRVLLQKSRPYSRRKHHVVHSIFRPEPGAQFLRQNPQFDFSKEGRSRKAEELKHRKGVVKSAIIRIKNRDEVIA